MYALRNVRQLALDGTKWPLREWESLMSESYREMILSRTSFVLLHPFPGGDINQDP